MDSAKPLFGVEDASSSSEASGGGKNSRSEPEPLSMALKSGFRRWPPYQAGAAKGAERGGGPDEEPQPLTREFKGGALAPSSAACSNSDDNTSTALRPPLSAFWVSCPERCLRDPWSPIVYAGGIADSKYGLCCLFGCSALHETGCCEGTKAIRFLIPL